MANPTDIREVDSSGVMRGFAQPSAQSGDTFWSGLIVQYAGAVAPTEWLLCNGDAVSRWTYAALFAAIGTAYGAGDGSTTFNLPNLRDKVTLGVSGTAPLASSGGAETVALALGDLPSHNHGGTSGSTTPANYGAESAFHSHTYLSAGANTTVSLGIGDQDVCGPRTGGSTGTRSADSVHVAANHNHSIPSAGSGTAHNNMMPYVALNHIIRI